MSALRETIAPCGELGIRMSAVFVRVLVSRRQGVEGWALKNKVLLESYRSVSEER